MKYDQIAEAYVSMLQEHTKRKFVGSCNNSFDDDGECINNHIPYSDVSNFAYHIMNDDGTNKEETKITKQQFTSATDISEPSHIKLLSKSDTEYLHDKENDQYMLYDPEKDIHHFYS